MLFSYQGKQLTVKSLTPIYDNPTPKRAQAQLRGVWVTTVRNNDFPSQEVYQNGFNATLFKKEFDDIIQICQKFKLNAIFFQIRPEGDAFYPSGVNPWSEYLTGEQGLAPRDGFDPLAYIISKTHQANMEFHAWLNPYRLSPWKNKTATKEEGLQNLSPNHYARRHPDWVFHFNGQLYLNPGVPAVTDFMVATVDEILNNYNVDAIHLDDFFYPYPYPEGDKMIQFKDVAPDQDTFLKYRVDQNQTISDWREANVNSLVYNLHKTIQRYNYANQKHVQFGISPFGIWASDQQAPGGSSTHPNQLASLDEYVNTKLWIEAGWLDYVIPQIYWTFEDPLSPFAVTAKWWNDITSGTKTKLYIGLGLYLYQEDQFWQDPTEIIRQIDYIKTLPNVSGYVFFTFHNLLEKRATTDAMKQALKQLQTHL